jgi:hypothetical protein
VAPVGWEGVSAGDIARMNRAKTGGPSAPLAPAPKRAKYRNTRTTVQGLVFASKKEADRYLYLHALQQLGAIHLLALQTRWEIYVDRPEGRRHIAWWLSDFDYWLPPTEGQPAAHVIEDTKGGTGRKGTRTDVYQLKKKLVEAIHGIVIREL